MTAPLIAAGVIAWVVAILFAWALARASALEWRGPAGEQRRNDSESPKDAA